MTFSAVSPAGNQSDRRLLLFVVLNVLIVNVFFKLVAHFVFHTGIDEMRVRYWHFFSFQQGTDSWNPMLNSVNYFLAHRDLPIYSAKLYDTLIYPLTSVLPLLWMKQAGMADAAVYRLLMAASWLAVCGVIALQAVIASAALKRSGQKKLSPLGLTAVIIGSFFFMPITLAFSLGQAQIFLDLFFSFLVLFWLQGRERSAGAMMALLTMVKPQYGLLILWSAMRRRWSALASGLITLALGFTASISAFGLRNNLDYLTVLSELSKKAQSHYANQSMFGLLNRAIFNGGNIGYTPYVYTPYIPWVYAVTLLTTIALVLLALLYRWRRAVGGMVDLSIAGIVCVIATPMAWEHHYGILLPIFAWFWFSRSENAAGKPRSNLQQPAWVALCFVLIADFLSPLNFLAGIPVANILQSYMYIGALLLIVILMKTENQYNQNIA